MSAVVFAFLVATASGRRVIQAADSDIVLDFSRHLSESLMMYGGYGYGGYYGADTPEITEEPMIGPLTTPPPVEVVSITPPPEEVVVITPPPVEVVSITPPPEEVVVITPPPVEVVSIAPPPEEVVVITPPPVDVAMPPTEVVAATPPPPDTGALINDSQEGLPFPPANSNGGPGQFSNIPGCQIDHVAEGSPGCELCQPGFFKLDNDGIADGDEICYPCDALENCVFCNDFLGCAQCEGGFTPAAGNTVVYNDKTQYYGVTFCVSPPALSPSA